MANSEEQALLNNGENSNYTDGSAGSVHDNPQAEGKANLPFQRKLPPIYVNLSTMCGF